MFDKRNMTITRRAAASSGPCLADRVWLTLWPASSHAQPGLACTGPMLDPGRRDQAGPQPGTRPDPVEHQPRPWQLAGPAAQL